MASSRPDQDHLKWSKVSATVPEGVDVPMCWCGDLCKLVQTKVLGDQYGMRFFMCDNLAYDPPKVRGSSKIEVRQVPTLCDQYGMSFFMCYNLAYLLLTSFG